MQFIHHGVTIRQCPPNPKGLRYCATTKAGVHLRAYSLSAIYQLIEEWE